MKVRAVRIREPGDPSVLEIVTVDAREPGPDEIAVRVVAAGLNRADLLQRRGLYPPPPSYPVDIPGLEYAGTVEAIGANVRSRQLGERVMGIIGGGGMAERVIIHEREAIPIPDRLTFYEAAAIPEVFLTAFDALLQADLRLGESILIHAVGSGVGTAFAQLSHATGATTLGTSRTADKLARAKEYGLDHGFEVKEGAFADRVLETTRGSGANVIVDPVGATYLAEDLRCLAEQGRVVIYGTMGGVAGELPIALLLARRARIFGTMLRGRPLEQKAMLAQRFGREIVPLLAAGAVRPVLAETLPMSAIAEAHARMERNETFGKTVLRWD